jgi:hypothetical protein
VEQSGGVIDKDIGRGYSLEAQELWLEARKYIKIKNIQ